MILRRRRLAIARAARASERIFRAQAASSLSAGGTADENAAPAGRVAEAGGIQRAGDGDALHTGAAGVDLPQISSAPGGLCADIMPRRPFCGPAFTAILQVERRSGGAILTRSPFRVSSSSSPDAPAPPTPIPAVARPDLESYSASSGKLWRTRIPPRVPSGRPSMCSRLREVARHAISRGEGLVSMLPTASG